MIQVRNLTKKYGDNTAVENLSFNVEKGKIYGLLGPNGAGKSTTMNIITGYIAATEGEVLINGYDILKEPGKAKACIGYLPEIPPLYTDMTVKEYLEFAAEIKGIHKSERKAAVEEAENIVQIKDVEHRLIKNLSKGYRQRVGFAQAVIGMPEILILDEPTAGLDPKQIIEIRDLIRQLGENHTVILSSHILSEISAVCDYVIIISKGRLAAADTAENLLKMISSSAVLNITVRASEESVDSILSKIENITEYNVSASAEKDSSDAEIRYDAANDIRDEIFRAFTEKNCSIIKMEAGSASLEEVFLEITENNDNVPVEEEHEHEAEAEYEEEHEAEHEHDSQIFNTESVEVDDESNI